jgi:polar amino acid transport system substrate-binding protein
MIKSQLRIFLTLWLAFVLGSQPLRAETLKGIRQRGKLIVAVKDNTRPLGFKDASGALQGLEIDIARRLSIEIFGVPDRVELRPVINQNRLRVLMDQQVDLTIARLTINRSRARVVDFSRSYYQDSTAILTNRSNLQQPRDLAGQRVAVIQSSSSAAEASYQLPQSQLVPVGSYQAAKELLDTKKVAAFVGDRSLLVGWSQEYPRQYRLLASNLAFSSIGVAVPRGRQYDELWFLVDSAIGRWQKSGWLRQRIRYWGL